MAMRLREGKLNSKTLAISNTHSWDELWESTEEKSKNTELGLLRQFMAVFTNILGTPMMVLKP